MTTETSLPSAAPERIAIDHDEHSAEYVGTTDDGRQFFLTTPFVPATEGFVGGGEPGREFLALYVFDQAGALLSATIEDLGTRAGMDEDAFDKRHDELLRSLGPVTLGRIEVAPFRIERFGIEFGFIPQPPEDDEDVWCVNVEPGNYMSFFPPWTSGEYDT
jgi:hypothetical protein